MIKNSISCLIVFQAIVWLMTFNVYSQSADGYYVSGIVSYEKGYVKASDDPLRFDPENTLGAPSNNFINFAALGFGGELVVKFPAPIKNGEGADLRIHETSFGNPSCDSWKEEAAIWVSQDNVNWVSLGKVCQTGDVSFPDGLDWILYVKIKDVSDPNFPWYGQNIDGYDVNAIQSLHGPLGPVVPLLECVDAQTDGSFTAFLGYHNHDYFTHSIPAGTNNQFSNATDQGQPVEFLPGVHAKDFFLVFDGSPVIWTLVGPDSVSRTVEFSSSSPACPTSFPTAKISGGAEFCETVGEAMVAIDLTGEAPWTVTYQNTVGQQTTVSGITSSPYTFITSEITTFTLVSVYDANGPGTVMGSATLAVYEKPSATVSGGGEHCDIPAQVTIRLSGNAPWSFSLVKDGAIVQNIANWSSPEYTFNASVSGQYGFVNLTDKFCDSESTGSVTIIFNDKPLAEISGGGTICADDGSVPLTIQLSGTPPFNVVYSDGTNTHTLSNIAQNTIRIDVTNAGSYQLVSVSDAHCTGTVSGLATVTDSRIQIDPSAPAEVCFGEGISLSSGFSATNLKFRWATTGKGTFDNPQSLNPTYLPGTGESGEITFTFIVEIECGEFSKSIKTDIKAPINSDFTVPDKIDAHKSVTFVPVQSGGDTYTWSIGNEISIDRNTLDYTFSGAGQYQVTLKVSKDGCENETVKTVGVEEIKKIVYVPNVFSPWASNPENRVVKVYGTSISTDDFIFKILNRWGNVMFETTSLNTAQNVGWDGRAKGTGEMQALGAYTYMLRGKFLDGEVFQKTGSVTLVK